MVEAFCGVRWSHIEEDLGIRMQVWNKSNYCIRLKPFYTVQCLLQGGCNPNLEYANMHVKVAKEICDETEQTDTQG